MKKFNLTLLKKTLHIAVFAAVFSISSCNENKESNDTKDTKEIVEDSNDAKLSNAKEEDADFLVSAAEIDLEEIQLGQLAQTNGSMPEVKELGKTMEVGHTQSFKALQILAAKKQITIPTRLTNDAKDAYDKLKNKFGIEFDTEYCDMMVKGHKDAINKFEKAPTEAKDVDIQSWAATLLISLRAHLAHSVVCQEECAKMKSKS